ncbi:MAG: hypothetical protein H0U87_03970 [Acidobacteria bacterium]|nr:hypothetical protein [Acidobacteriota bacterium]
MASRNIIVIGASAGEFEALKKLVDDLPTDLQASFLYIVWHMSPDVRGVLPQVLNHTFSRSTIAKSKPFNSFRGRQAASSSSARTTETWARRFTLIGRNILEKLF